MIVPTTEPTSIIKGDTVKWTKSLLDYPATAWTLKYALRGAASIDVTATASGSDFAVTLTATATAAYTLGSYVWSSYVEQGAERYTISSGSLVINENPTAIAIGSELRSKAQIILDNLLAAYQTYTATQGGIKRYQIGDREMEYKDSASLLKDIQYWQQQVANEKRAADLSAGRFGRPNTLFARFTTRF